MNEQELKDKILELESLNAVQASKIKSLEQEVEKLSKNGCYWANKYHLLKLYGPSKVDDGEGYNTPAPAPKISTLHNTVKILSQGEV